MRYKIKDIPEEGLVCDQPIERALLGDALAGLGADIDRSAAAVRLEITRSQDDIYVRGTVSATLGLSCAACLGPARIEVSLPIKMVYVYAGPDAAEDDDRDEDEALAEEDIGEHDGHTLDLQPMIREQLILSVPMSPRCREGCKGLCPECGQDRNERDCGHRGMSGKLETEKRSPFAALKDVKLTERKG